MSKIVKIDVTQEDINAGKKHSCRKCPIALAAKRALGKNFEDITVGLFFLYYGGKDDRVTVLLPVVASNFIYNFDASMTTNPFSFEIAIP